MIDEATTALTDRPGAALELVGVTRTFPAESPVHALVDVDLSVAIGEHLCIVGPSGSGKSTLLNVLGLLDRPTVGRYTLFGQATEELGEADRAALRASRIGFIFQAFHLLPGRTALENVVLGGMYAGTGRRERAERARLALERVGLAHRMDAYPPTMSGGERQRVAIARAVSTGAAVLLADEPTGNLDEENTVQVLDLFDELRGDGLTLVVITHDDLVASRGTRRIRIADGRIVA